MPFARSALAVLFALLAAPTASASTSDEIIVVFKSGVSAAERSAARAQAGVDFAEASVLGGEQLVAAEGSRAASLEALRRDPRVELAEPNVVVTPASADPYFPEQWALENTGQAGASGISGAPDADIDAPEAWAQQPGAPGVLVGVVDTGLSPVAPDLPTDARWRNPGEIAGNGVDDDRNGFIDDVTGWNTRENNGDTSDASQMHGTIVASIIAARRDNATHIAGIAPATIVPVRMFDANHLGSSWDAAQGMRYLARLGVRIVNLSVGSAGDPGPYAAQVAADYPDTLFVFASGNDGADVDAAAPAAQGGNAYCRIPAENLVCVGSSDRWDQRSLFSSYGAESVDLLAPGDDVFTASDDAVSWSGTSLAAPHVSGVAALLLSAAPHAGARQLRAALLAGVDPIDAAREITSSGGRLNAAGALRELATFDAGAPRLTQPPTIDSDVEYNVAATASSGQWTHGSVERIQWERCHPAIEHCWAIDGASATTYTPINADIGFRLRLRVVARSGSGQTVAYSVPGDLVVAGAQAHDVAPAAATPPEITGSFIASQPLTLTPGTWEREVTRTTEWLRCNITAETCNVVQVGGSSLQTDWTYDRATVRVRETVANAAGTTTVTSAATPPLDIIPAAFTTQPTLSGMDAEGRAHVGSTLTLDGEQYTGTPILRVDVHWYACATTGTCYDLVATGRSYTVRAADRGKYLQAVAGVVQSSRTTSSRRRVVIHPVGASAPTLDPPRLTTTTPRVGETLHVDVDADGVPTPASTATWQSCDFTDCVTRATGLAYQPSTTDVGRRLRVRVTASNAYGTTDAVSSQSATVAAAPVAPAIAGLAVRGDATVGGQVAAQVTTTPSAATAQILWLRCSSRMSADCTAYGAHGDTLALDASWTGAYVRARVTAEHDGLSTTSTSEPIGPLQHAAQPPTGPEIPTGSVAPPTPTALNVSPIDHDAHDGQEGGDPKADEDARRDAAKAITVSSSLRLRRGLRLPLTCRSPGGCEGSLTILARSRVLARGRIALERGRGEVRLRLTRTGRREIGSRARTVSLRINLGDVRITRRLTLRR